jgi:hypothetical protein
LNRIFPHRDNEGNGGAKSFILWVRTAAAPLPFANFAQHGKPRPPCAATRHFKKAALAVRDTKIPACCLRFHPTSSIEIKFNQRIYKIYEFMRPIRWDEKMILSFMILSYFFGCSFAE